MLKYIAVNEKNKQLAKQLQAEIFPNEQSPKQIDIGVKTGDPKNFIVYNGRLPVGIVGYYSNKKYPKHLFVNWYGVVNSARGNGFGTQIMQWLINLCKNTTAEYLTTYTEKFENCVSIKVYNKLGFDIKDYANKQDIKKFTSLGKQNDYVVCCLKLNSTKSIHFEKMYLKVYDDLLETEKKGVNQH